MVGIHVPFCSHEYTTNSEHNIIMHYKAVKALAHSYIYAASEYSSIYSHALADERCKISTAVQYRHSSVII